MKWMSLIGGAAALALGLAACAGENRGSGSRMGVPAIPGTQGFVVPPLPPDTFTRVDTLTMRNPTIQTPFLSQSKDSFTATTLKNGLVMLIGGTTGGTGLTDAEIYDQRSAEFMLTGSTGQGRRHHTANVTSAGDIVVIGGIGQSQNPLISAEIWRSSSGLFEVVGQMATPRAGHTATLLPSGGMLVIGGITDNNGQKVTESVQSLNLSNRLWLENTAVQATQSISGIPRALHTATPIAGPDGIPGNSDDLIVMIGGLQGNRLTKNITNVTNSVSIYYPNETTQPPGKPMLPGRWRNLSITGLPNASAIPARLGHAAFVIGATANVTQVMFVGGLMGTIPSGLGPFTDTTPASSFLEDSPGTSYVVGADVAILDIDNTTLTGPNPRAAINEAVDYNALMYPFVGGFGARVVYSPGRMAAIHTGGQSFCPTPPPPPRCAYNRNGIIIGLDQDQMTGLLSLFDPQGNLLVVPSGGQMSDIRSFHASARLPGADGLLDTPDDTVLVAGGEQSPSGENNSGDEYTFPP